MNVLYGCIVVPDSSEGMEGLYLKNAEIIRALGEVDMDYPPLTSGIFSSPRFVSGSRGVPGFESQTIHFGASYKNLYYEWGEWIYKFELLISNMYWSDVYLNFKGMPQDYEYKWTADRDLLSQLQSNAPLPVTKWNFEGGPRHFEIG